MIRTLLFDMGNVLVYFSHELMCAQMGSLCGKEGDEIRHLMFHNELQWNYERGQVTSDDFFEQFQQAVGRGDLDRAAFVRAACEIFELNASLIPVLDELKLRGYRLLLLSNTSVGHFEYIQREFDVLKRFDDFVLSYEVGVLKPEPAIFEAALKKIECAPHEAFYTDDIADNVRAAREFGLNAEIFTTTDALREQLATLGVQLGTPNPLV